MSGWCGVRRFCVLYFTLVFCAAFGASDAIAVPAEGVGNFGVVQVY